MKVEGDLPEGEAPPEGDINGEKGQSELDWLTSWGGQLRSFQEWSNKYISILFCVLLLFDFIYKQLESRSLAAMKKI